MQEIKYIEQLPAAFNELLKQITELRAELSNKTNTGDIDALLDVEGAAAFLHMQKQSIYDLVGAKKIPYSKPAKKLLFLKSDLLDWVKEHRQDGAAKKRALSIKTAKPAA